MLLSTAMLGADAPEAQRCHPTLWGAASREQCARLQLDGSAY